MPLNSVGVRASDYWTEENMVFTNALTGERQRLQLKGASWFGLQGRPCYPGGASQAPLAGNMAFLRANRFNALRVPLAQNALTDTPVWDRANCQGSDGLFITFNPDFGGLGYMQMLSKFIRMAGDHGLLVMLDIHVTRAGVWPDAGTIGGLEGGQSLLSAWTILAEHFCDPKQFWNVFAADLKNEPHGMYWGPSAGGSPSSYPENERWDALASEIGNAIHRICPRWLIFVEGVGHCMATVPDDHSGRPHPCPAPSAAGQDVSIPTWWGENLQAALQFPVSLNSRQKVVYSPHVYGPSVYPQPYFRNDHFPANMPAIWHTQWGYIAQQRAFPVVIGEWGGRYVGDDKKWQDAMATFLKDPANAIAGNFYWCLNPDSGDTGGLLKTWGSMGSAGDPDRAKLLMLANLEATVIPTTVTRPPNAPEPPPPPPSPLLMAQRPLGDVALGLWTPPVMAPLLPKGASGEQPAMRSTTLHLMMYFALALTFAAVGCEVWRHRYKCLRSSWTRFADDSTSQGVHAPKKAAPIGACTNCREPSQCCELNEPARVHAEEPEEIPMAEDEESLAAEASVNAVDVAVRRVLTRPEPPSLLSPPPGKQTRPRI